MHGIPLKNAAGQSYKVKIRTFRLSKEALAIRRVFSLVDMITNTAFSNCTLVYKTDAVRQQNMQSKHQNMFQSKLSLAKK